MGHRSRERQSVRLLAPLGQRPFRLLLSALAISLLGDGVFLVAVAWQAYALKDRPAALAAVGLSASLPQLALLLVGGAISDRCSRPKVLRMSDLARGTAVGALAAVGWMGQLRLWHLCAAAVVIGAGTAFASPAFDAFVPELVSEEHLQHANGLDQLLRPVTLRLLGPALGGVVVGALGPEGAFAADAASFFFSAWLVWRIRLDPLAACGPQREDSPSLRADLREGLRYVRRHVWLWGTFTSATITYLLFLGPTEVLLPYLVKNDFHAGAETLGLVLGAGGLGAVAGAVVVGQRDQVRRPMTFIYVTWAAATLAVAGYGLATQRWQLAIAAVVVHALEAAGTVVWATLKQRLVPGHLLGRVSSIDWFVSIGLMPLSYALTPLAAQLFGVRTTLLGAGVIGAGTTIGFLLLPGVRSCDSAG